MFYKITEKEALDKLNTTSKGLTSDEAEKRLVRYGYNELIQYKKTPFIQLLAAQFINIIVLILIAAAVVSFFLSEIVDFIVIITIVIINAFLGVIQERKAENALEALRKMSAPIAEVMRDGKRIVISSKDIVPGDIIFLKTGDKVPCDCRILEQMNLKSDESMLTGESLPVTKNSHKILKDAAVNEQKNMLFSGCIIVYGRCTSVAATTGMKTEFGKLASLIQVKKEDTPLQKNIGTFGKYLGILIIAVCAVVFLAGFLQGRDPSLIFLVAVTLAVAVVPEGLPAVVTITLAIGLLRMAKRNAIIRKLSAAETLGCATVICSDKTGTLTVNQMTVKKLFVDNKIIETSGSGYGMAGEFYHEGKPIKMDEDLRMLVGTGLLCNDAILEGAIGDPTEIALLVSASKAGLPDLREKNKRTDEIPFDSERKMMSTVYEIGGEKISYTKGAVEQVMAKCSLMFKNGKTERIGATERKRILEVNREFTENSMRVLAFAYKKADDEIEEGMTFVGLQAMIDPPRSEVRNAIERCKKAGIRVIMITGDHKNTATSVAKEIGIEGSAITGEELSKMNEEEKTEAVTQHNIFARVHPEHKVMITEILQKKGNVVAMTGDGVNDAPALKKSDIGIAMGMTGTEVAKEASDMVLADDNFSSIVSAVEEGRNIYDNIKKFILYLLTAGIGEVIAIFSAIVIGLPLPLIPVQILWMNLLTNGLPALALGVEVPEPDIMERPPRKKDEKIVGKDELITITLAGVIMGLGTLGIFLYELGNGTVIHAQTMAFTAIVMLQLASTLSFRSQYPLAKIGLFSNKKLILAIALSLALQLAVLYIPFLNTAFGTVPLSAMDWLKIIALSSTIIVAMEARKMLKRKKSGKKD